MGGFRVIGERGWASAAGIRLLCVGLAAVAFCWECAAWGPDGHRIAGAIAQAHLSKAARAAVKELLGDVGLAEASLWADEVKDNPAYDFAKPLHYVNVPRGARRVSMREHCDSGQCVLGAIERCRKELQDAELPRERRAEALKFLIHFVQDVHQPLHVAYADDRGGNSIVVSLYGEPDWNLHRVWDLGLIRRRLRDFDGDWSKAADRMLKDISERELRQWRRTDNPVAWANESLDITRGLYDQLPKDGKLDEAYYAEQIDVIEDRLAASGVRLAQMLNEIFDEAEPNKAPEPAEGSKRPAQ